MEIKKISLSSNNNTQKRVDATASPAVESLSHDSEENNTKTQSPLPTQPVAAGTTMKKKLSKKIVVPVVTLVLLLALSGSLYALLGKFIQWEEDPPEIDRKADLSVDVSDLPTPTMSSGSGTDTEKSGSTAQAKGKITVTFLKDKGAPFDNGILQLRNASGTVINSLKTGPDGTSGVVVFGEVPAGSYTVIGGRENEIAVRSVSQTVSLTEGEFANVTLRLYIDTPVSISVTVTDNSGSPVANKTFNLVRPRGDEGDEVLSVSTNGSGVFSASNIYPDDRWTLRDGETDLARFTVAPTGQNQNIYVKTNSN